MKQKKKIILIISFIILILICVFTYCYFENNNIQVSKIEITNKKIPQSFNDFKIVQVSDLHNKEFGKENNKLIKLIKESKPDIIVLTGDLIDSSRKDFKIVIDFINQINKISPIYFVGGNHEASIDDYNDLINKLETFGVIILNNKIKELTLNDDTIYLIGLNDPNFENYYTEDADVLKAYLNEMEINNKKYNILLSHRPELFDLYEEYNIDLVLSGHAHGGQFRIPFVGGIIAPNQGIFPKYTSGIYEKDNTKMIVSRGLGNSIIPFRINNNPELVVVTLKSKK